MSDTTPFPDLPPPPADPGEFITHFAAHIASFRFDRDNNLQLILTVAATDKYNAMPLTDVRGRAFGMSVYAERGKRPLVRAGTLGVYDAREKVKQKQADRRWNRVLARNFLGHDDEDGDEV